jgi:hypothetical protein
MQRDTQLASEQDVGNGADFLNNQSMPNGSEQYDAPPAGGNGDDERITDINQLDAQMEELAPVDEKRLEDLLEYAPTIKPGTWHNFIFKLDTETPVEGKMIKGKMAAQFNYNAQELRDDGTPGKTIRFNQANTYRTGKMEASRAEELLFALGKLKEYQAGPRVPSAILKLLSEASDNQVTFRGLVHWRRYDKTTYETWSTAPAKPYERTDKATGAKVTVTEKPWPRHSDGTFDSRPAEFEGNYGNEIIARVAPMKQEKIVQQPQEMQQAA